MSAPPPKLQRRRRSGFTLGEVVVASAVGAIVMVGVMLSFTAVQRSGIQIEDQYKVDQRKRELFTMLSRDLYSATSVTWNSATSLTVTRSDGTRTYSYNSGTKSISYTTNSGTARTVLSDVASFTFAAYDISGTALSLAGSLTTASSQTRFVQIQATITKARPGMTTYSESIASPLYMIRKK